MPGTNEVGGRVSSVAKIRTDPRQSTMQNMTEELVNEVKLRGLKMVTWGGAWGGGLYHVVEMGATPTVIAGCREWTNASSLYSLGLQPHGGTVCGACLDALKYLTTRGE